MRGTVEEPDWRPSRAGKLPGGEETMPDIDGEPQVLLARAVELTKAERQARDETDAALAARDEALARAHAAGVTMYRLSKETHLSKTATRVAIMRASPELQKKDR